MNFVELNRFFVPLAKDQEPNLDIGRVWGRRYSGWLDWKELCEFRRVVLLAEASSGKSEEFRNQCQTLVSEGKAAFFLRIEELADQGFEAALEPDAAKAFERWGREADEGWFFLDSVDEARLNRKSFETALKRLARELDQSLERARIYISCRVTDWKSPEDRISVERLLPAWERADVLSNDRKANPLLDPIFDKKNKTAKKLKKSDGNKKWHELQLVQLVPLQNDQYRILAAAAGVEDVDQFAKGIFQSGLDAFTERPGDVLDLAEYWNTYAKFGAFSEMLDHSVIRKLNERDTHRTDNEALTPTKAIEGAERLAAALTLGKSFTLRAPNHDPDPSLASGAIDPRLVLTDWSDAERNALLRRGVFAPSTYGRIRFHHRATQEFLTAKWLHRLLAANFPRNEMWQLIFAERYGVQTVVPSLRPAAAWLALWNPDFCDEIIRREPLVLLKHGDPSSLSLTSKQRLLTTFADKHAAGQIADDSLDNRALWMFAEARLAASIREAWIKNDRDDFRLDLLRLIREGAINECRDLARSVATDSGARGYNRISAIQALQACGDTVGLGVASHKLLTSTTDFSAAVASAFAVALYPVHLTTDQLIAVIANSSPSKPHSADGFGYHLPGLYDASPNKVEQQKLVRGLAQLCLSRPFVDEYHRVSKRYAELAGGITRIAREEVVALGSNAPSDSLVQLLIAVERSHHDAGLDDPLPSLSTLIRSNPTLNRSLFWADVNEQRMNAGTFNDPSHVHQVHSGGYQFWGFGSTDISWLEADVVTRQSATDRCLALSAIVAVFHHENRLSIEEQRLRKLVSGQPRLTKELECFLAPPAPSEAMQEYERRHLQRTEEREIQERLDKASWIEFKRDIESRPDVLRDPKALASWSGGSFRLKHLTDWLAARIGSGGEKVPHEWRLLEEGFNREVAEAYRDGMKVLWRITKPERPARKGGGPISFKWTTILSYQAIGLEASEDPAWATRLNDQEAGRATLHGCYSDQGYPDWIESLADAYPQIVLPVVRRILSAEWTAEAEGRSTFLYRYANSQTSIPSAVQQFLFETLSGSEPKRLATFDLGLRIIRRISPDEVQKQKLYRISQRRLSRHLQSGPSEWALRYLALQLLINIDAAIGDLESWLGYKAGRDEAPHAEQTFGILFDRHDPLVLGALERASVSTLQRLLELAYENIHPQDDAVHEGVFSENTRDKAEGARNVILSALIERPGAEAFRALEQAAAKPAFTARVMRFREIARGKAERDTDPPAWTEIEIAAFRDEHTAPAKTGSDLMRIVLGTLRDIQSRLTEGDVTSRPLLERAKDEEEVKNWLVEQMNFRSRQRFHVFRESQVSHGNKPDVIVASTSGQCEVALEVKHGGMEWSPRQLEPALRVQLAANYLHPATRRHGVLVISHHGKRHWRNPDTNRQWSFQELIEWLREIGNTITTNGGVPIEVTCSGIDASRPVRAPAS